MSFKNQDNFYMAEKMQKTLSALSQLSCLPWAWTTLLMPHYGFNLLLLVEGFI